MEILLLVVCAMLSGAEGWEAIEEFGKNKLVWLRKVAPFANGIVVALIDPQTTAQCGQDKATGDSANRWCKEGRGGCGISHRRQRWV